MPCAVRHTSYYSCPGEGGRRDLVVLGGAGGEHDVGDVCGCGNRGAEVLEGVEHNVEFSVDVGRRMNDGGKMEMVHLTFVLGNKRVEGWRQT